MTRRQSAQVSDRRHLSARERSLAWYPFGIAIDPQIFCFKEIPVQDESQEQWHRQNLCVHLATHPNNERNMQAAVAGLVAEMVKRTDNPRGIIYGVVFSMLLCASTRKADSLLSTAVHCNSYPLFMPTHLVRRGLQLWLVSVPCGR